LIALDSSAIVAIFLAEPTREQLLERLTQEDEALLSPANYVETGQVLVERRKIRSDEVLDELHTFMRRMSITIAPVDEEQAHVALHARIVYGRGFGHRARLNYSDCFAYALAKVRGLPLLYVGDDFIHTDIVSALA
jgi:ribonuclease VapC